MGDDTPPRMTAKSFHAHPGVEDWRVLFWGAHAFYTADSLTHAVALAGEVAAIAADLDHHPDLDVRPHGVTIRTRTRASGGLGPLDAELARRIQAVARERGHRADPSTLMVTGIAVAQDRDADVRPFWAAIMGYDELDDADAVDPQRRNPHVWVHELTPPKPGRGRTHIDLSMPADHAKARVDAALAAGGRLVSESPEGWTIASPDNHGVDIAIWPDFEDFGEEG
ncbi:MAG TPA: VOC family protein [Phytomonospora sp.]